VAAAEQAFRVYATKVPQPGSGSYLMDHTSFIYLIDPDGHLRALFGSDATAATLAARMQAVLA
jgi:protein SCO1/2